MKERGGDPEPQACDGIGFLSLSFSLVKTEAVKLYLFSIGYPNYTQSVWKQVSDMAAFSDGS